MLTTGSVEDGVADVGPSNPREAEEVTIHDGVPIYIHSPTRPPPGEPAGSPGPGPVRRRRRMFEHRGIQQRELERIRVLEGDGGVNHLRYRVLR